MFFHLPQTYQDNVITKFNLLVDAFVKAGINTKLKKLDIEGTCNGLIYCYKMYAHQDQRDIYVLLLMFIATLDTSKINTIVKKYKLAKSENKNFTITIEGHTINFDKIISITQGVVASQSYQTLKQIGVIWEKTYSFICHKDKLEAHLNNAGFQNGNSVFMDIGVHVFYIEKAQDGFYLFEPNHINMTALFPYLLPNTQALAKHIIENCSEWMGANPYVAFSMSFISYAKQSHLEFDHAIKKALDHLVHKPQLYFMSAQNDGFYAPSDQDNIYLYQNGDNIFYLKKINNENKHEKQYLNINPQQAISNASFDQQLIHPQACQDNKTRKIIFTMISAQVDTSLENSWIKIKSIIKLYHEKKISRLDCALTLNTILNDMNNHSAHVINFKTAVQIYLNNKQIIKFIADTHFEQDKRYLGMHAFSFKLSLLYLAASTNQILLVSQLLKEDIPINTITEGAGSPLYTASSKNYAEMTALLLSHQEIDPNFPYKGVSPLYKATDKGYASIVKLLLSHKKTDANLQYKEISPLYIASQHGHTKIVALLLSRDDINVDLRFRDATPLYIASQHGHNSIVKLLIESNASLHTSISAATSFLMKHAEISKKENAFKELLMAKHNGHIPNTLPHFTPLHAAVFFGHQDVAASLLTAKADIHAISSGISCLELAQTMGHKAIITLLELHIEMAPHSTLKV